MIILFIIFCFFLVFMIYKGGLMLVILFFFSSRRRHTRSKRDWSSDVCSSDLGVRTARILFWCRSCALFCQLGPFTITITVTTTATASATAPATILLVGFI